MSDYTEAAPVVHDIAVPCNDIQEDHYLAEMRHVDKATVSVASQHGHPTKSTNPNMYAAPNARSVPPLREENGHEIPEDVVGNKNDANAYQEKGSHSLSDMTTKDGIFTSANTGFHDDERVVMTPMKDVNDYSSAAFITSHETSVSVGKFSQETSSNNGSLLTSSSEGEQRGPNFSFKPQPTQIDTHNPESYTVAVEEVFEQEVPPTPMEPKQHHYSTDDGNHPEGTIGDCLQESVNVEPVEEKVCESGGEVAEAGMDMPLRSQQQCLDEQEQALVIPSLKPPHKPALDVNNLKHRLYGTNPQLQ